MTGDPTVFSRVDAAVRAASDELGRLDSVAGDGDLGVTMSRATAALLQLRDELTTLPVADLLARVGATVAREAPSTAGTLISFGLAEASRLVAVAPPERVVPVGLRGIAAGIADIGGAHAGDKTMLDALLPAAAAAERAADEGQDPRACLIVAAAAARDGAAATADMTPRFGRAAWAAERSSGSVDGGATLVAIVLAALAEG